MQLRRKLASRDSAWGRHLGKVKVKIEWKWGNEILSKPFNFISGQANSKLSYEMRGFWVFSEQRIVLPLNYGGQKLRNCKQVYVRGCIFVEQLITNSQAFQVVACKVTDLAPDLTKKPKQIPKPANFGACEKLQFKKPLKCVGKYLRELWELWTINVKEMLFFPSKHIFVCFFEVSLSFSFILTAWPVYYIHISEQLNKICQDVVNHLLQLVC